MSASIFFMVSPIKNISAVVIFVKSLFYQEHTVVTGNLFHFSYVTIFTRLKCFWVKMIHRSYGNNQTEWKKTYECDVTFIDKRKEILRKKKQDLDGNAGVLI